MGKYLVTGAAGFVGANVVMELLRVGEEVLACDFNDPPRRLLDESAEAGEVSWRQMDVSRAKQWMDISPTGVDAVIHAAAITNSEGEESPSRAAEVNLMGALYAADWARAGGIDRLVFTSSSAVYRYTEFGRPLREDDPVDPRFSYGLSKVAAEKYLDIYRKDAGLAVCSVRLPSVFGPWERPTESRVSMSPVYHLVRAALSRRPLLVAGEDAGHDWTYAKDVARGLIHLARRRGEPHLLNLSTGCLTTLADILKALDDLIPDHRIRITDPARADLVMTPTSGAQPMDISRLEETGFGVDTSLRDALSDYIEWIEAEDSA